MTIAVSPVQLSPATRQELKALVETYYDAQKFRQRGYNRFWALREELSDAERMLILFNHFKDVENAMAKEIAKLVKEEPINEWLQGRRGVGPVMSAAIICSGLDPTIDKPSSWWRFAGVGIVDGKNQRLRRGQKRGYNGFLRRTLEVIVSQFLRAHQPQHGRPSYYAEWYYRFKGRSEADASRSELAPIHHHRRAIMLTERLFLTHLQEKWREVLGMSPPRFLYIVEKEPGVHHQIPAPD